MEIREVPGTTRRVSTDGSRRKATTSWWIVHGPGSLVYGNSSLETRFIYCNWRSLYGINARVHPNELSRASLSAGPSNYKVVEHFLGMGFSEGLIERPIKDNGEANTDAILNSLLTYAHLEESRDEINSCNQQQQCVDDYSFNLSSDDDESALNDLSESGSWSGSWSGSDAAECSSSLPKHEKALLSLANMGYGIEEGSAAMDRCGQMNWLWPEKHCTNKGTCYSSSVSHGFIAFSPFCL